MDGCRSSRVPSTVVLAGGDTIKGKLVERSDFAIILENPDLGRVEIPRERSDSLKIKSREFKMETTEGWFDKEMRWLNARTSRLGEKGWKASFDLSLDSATGNTDEQATRFGGHVKRSLPDLRLALDMSYFTVKSAMMKPRTRSSRSAPYVTGSIRSPNGFPSCRGDLTTMSLNHGRSEQTFRLDRAITSSKPMKSGSTLGWAWERAENGVRARLARSQRGSSERT